MPACEKRQIGLDGLGLRPSTLGAGVMIEGDGSDARAGRVDLAATPDFDLGSLRIRPRRRHLIAPNGEIKALEPRVMQVLVALARSQNEVVSRDELNDSCWDGRIVGDNAINRCILSLRRLSRSIDPTPFAIETIARVGYSLVQHTPAADAQICDRGQPPAHPQMPPREGPEAQASVARQPPASVAVLPFANLTGEPAKDYLADGLAEELITVLSRATRLKVPARTSSFSYRGRHIDIREIARQLGVAAIVEGSLRAAGGRIRLTIQLIDAATGFHLWSENFDRELGDLLELQDELARSVAAALGRELARSTRDTGNPEAMRLLLQGRSVAARQTADALARSEALLRKAIGLDPIFARAREGLAGTLLVAVNSGALPFEARDEARREAEHALALDPGLSGARGIIACLDALRGEWSEAERNFTQALESDESDALVHAALAQHVLLPAGLHGRARRHAERALELSPARAGMSLLCALCEAMRGDNAAVSRYLDMAIMLGISERYPPLQVMRADCLMAEGRFDEAATEAAAAVPAVARNAGGEEIVADAYRTMGGLIEPSGASARVSALFDACAGCEEFWRDSWLPGGLFVIQACLGARDESYRLAAAVIERRRLTRHLSSTSLIPLWFPALASFRADPRFHTFAGDLGMLDYWSNAGPPDGYELREGALFPARGQMAQAEGGGGWPLPLSHRPANGALAQPERRP